jgi:hypothetical protein
VVRRIDLKLMIMLIEREPHKNEGCHVSYSRADRVSNCYLAYNWWRGRLCAFAALNGPSVRSSWHPAPHRAAPGRNWPQNSDWDKLLSGRNRVEGDRPIPQKTNYAADAGRIAELQRDIRSGAMSASALVVFPVRAFAHPAHRHRWAWGSLAQARLTFAKPNRFQRGPLAGCPASASGADLDPSLAPPATCIRRDSSAKLEPEAYAAAAPATPLLPLPHERRMHSQR